MPSLIINSFSHFVPQATAWASPSIHILAYGWPQTAETENNSQDEQQVKHIHNIDGWWLKV